MTNDTYSEKCSICREPMCGGSQPDYMLRCNHRFHVECIIDSLRKSRECPVCRDTGIDSPNQITQYSYELEDVYDWNIELHQNCFCCASKNKDSEYYDTYNLIKGVSSNNPALLSDYKQSKTIKHNLVNSILKKYNKENDKLTRKYDRERQLLYRSLANEPDYIEYKEVCHKYRGSKLRLRNAIWRELNGMGYEREETMEKLVQNYIRGVSKNRSLWRIRHLIQNISKYTLDKYAPKPGEEGYPVNNVVVSMEI